MSKLSSIPPHTDHDEDAGSRVHFLKMLQTVTNKIHSTGNIDEIMLDLSRDICELAACDRLTIYVLSEGKTSIETKVKTGLHSFKDFSLPISDKSIAGYVALTKKVVNIRDVYDEAELNAISPGLHYISKIDQRTGYRSKQMLVAPLVNAQTRELLGVLQLINSHTSEAFPKMVEEGLKELCETLAIAFAQRLKPPLVIRSKYHPLVAEAVLSLPELELAGRLARRKGRDIQDVLVNEFQVKLSDIGESLARFFGVPYEGFKKERIRPAHALQNFAPEYFEQHRWLLLEERAGERIILTTNPERIKTSLMLDAHFPQATLAYRVTTHREFKQTLDQLFGAAEDADPAAQDAEETNSIDRLAQAENALINRVNTVIIDAFRQEDACDITIELHPAADKTVSRFRKDGSLEGISGQTTIGFHVSVTDEDGKSGALWRKETDTP